MDSSFAKFREMIATQYTDITIVSIAGVGCRNVVFAAYGYRGVLGDWAQDIVE